ncbi:MAG: LytTR family DNA-binding domain-containing protein [Ignavibacteriales bacterium]
MNKKIRTIIVEDEKLARDLLKNYLSKYDDFSLIGECENGFTAVKSINELKPDLIFLDIQLPKINGFEIIELLEHNPQIIFTTAFDEYAVKAFEVNAIDYLMKPYSLDRFEKALEKIKSNYFKSESDSNIRNLSEKFISQSQSFDRIVVKKNKEIIIIPVDEIIYFESQDDYVAIKTVKGKFIKNKTMKFYEDFLQKEKFVRIHRSYILNISYLKKIESIEKDSHYAILTDENKLPISKSGFSKLKLIMN